MYIGMTNHSIDSKGRIVLPAKFREELGETFYILRCHNVPGIQVLSVEAYKSINEQISALPLRMAQILQYTYAATASEVTPNAQGRIAIPQKLREYAGIKDEAIVIGMYDHIEIWNEERYNNYVAEKSADVDDVLEAFDKISLKGGI